MVTTQWSLVYIYLALFQKAHLVFEIGYLSLKGVLLYGHSLHSLPCFVQGAFEFIVFAFRAVEPAGQVFHTAG